MNVLIALIAVKYENGFEDLNGEFWIGLRSIHRPTKLGALNC